MRYQGRKPSEPKPFAYVDIPKDIRKSKFVAHDRFYEGELTGELKLDLQVISDYLYVGSGNYDFRERDKLPYYSFSRTDGGIVIPGTSIKGAVRSVAEALSNSCVSQIGKGEKGVYKKCEFDPEKKKMDLCPSCKLFGTTGYAGRANFADASQDRSNLEIVKIQELFPPRINKGKRKFYQNKLFNSVGNLKSEPNYRFVEAVKKGGTFKTHLTFNNISKDELALLFCAMGVGQNYMIKIGGAKPRCFGTVNFSPINLKLWQDPLDKAEEKSGEHLENFIIDVLAHNNLVVPELLRQFKTEVTKPKELCPKGIY